MLPSAITRPARRGALLAALMSLPGVTYAAAPAEDSIKAGYVFNFAKYTEWPVAALSSGEFRVCGLGLQPLSGKLAQLQGRQIQGLDIKVLASVRPEEWRSCHVLFIPASESQRTEAVLRNVAQAPVLTVSDGADFAQSGGMIGLSLRSGRIRFDINQGAARRTNLIFSSQLLKLADEVLP